MISDSACWSSSEPALSPRLINSADRAGQNGEGEERNTTLLFSFLRHSSKAGKELCSLLGMTQKKKKLCLGEGRGNVERHSLHVAKAKGQLAAREREREITISSSHLLAHSACHSSNPLLLLSSSFFLFIYLASCDTYNHGRPQTQTHTYSQHIVLKHTEGNH